MQYNYNGLQVEGKVLRSCVKVDVEQSVAAQNLRHQSKQDRAVGSRAPGAVDIEGGYCGAGARWTRRHRASAYRVQNISIAWSSVWAWAVDVNG